MNTQTLGKYVLKRHLATGGMAEIWLAEQSGPGGFQRELVIKRILPHLANDKDFTQMFLDEAHLVAQLNHPQIAQIYELGQVDGHYFIAMEYLDGIDVEQLLELVRGTNSQLPLNIACKIVSDVLLALDYAHEFTDKDGKPYHLVHRDISPQNVLLSNDGVIKLVDFGVAKAVVNRSRTEPGGVKGKFAYMAPEQIQSKNVDRRADLFAVGLLLFEVLTTSRPFGDDLQAVTGIMSLDPPDARTIRPDIPQSIVDVLTHALQKDPNDRYQDANEMLRDISNNMLALGGMVTDRDVSAYVRRLRGLPTLRTSKTEIPSPYVPPPSVAPHVGSPTPLPEPTTGPVLGLIAQTDELAVYSEPDTGASVGMSREAAEEKNTGLIVMMLLMTALIIAFGVGAVIFLTQPNEEVEKTPQVKALTFVHHDGLPVLILSEPTASIYYEGKKVGMTPFDTTLRKGSYALTFKIKEQSMGRQINVVEGKMIQRFKFKFKP